MTELRTQSRLASFIEAVANTVIGFGIAVGATYFLWYVYGIKASHSTLMIVTGWMTVLSVLRGYCLRRLWNMEWWTLFKLRHDADNSMPPLTAIKSKVVKSVLLSPRERARRRGAATLRGVNESNRIPEDMQ